MEYTVPSGKVFAGDQVSCYPLMLLSTVFWYIAKVMSALSFKKKGIKKDQNSSTWKTPLDLSCRRAVSWWRASTELHLTVSDKQKSSCTEMPAASSLTNVWAYCCIPFLIALFLLCFHPHSSQLELAFVHCCKYSQLLYVLLTGDLSCCGLAMSGRQRVGSLPFLKWSWVFFLFCNVRNVQILEEN